ncbi:MAG: inositol monophosphatase family protein [Planctomycetota bacterium]
MPDEREVCEAAARAGGRVLREWVGRFGVSAKGPRDLVTEADLAAQEEIRRILLGAFPDHGFIGEEGGHVGGGADAPCWYVDPLDGTTNYVHGFPAYCVSVALARGDEILVGTIYDPLRDECFTARSGAGAWLDGTPIRTSGTTSAADALATVGFPPNVDPDEPAVADFLAVLPVFQGVRRTGSTALNLAFVACGRCDAFWIRRIAPWDVAAGLLLVAEAGGVVLPIGPSYGSRVSLQRPAFIAAASRPLAEAIAAALPRER